MIYLLIAIGFLLLLVVGALSRIADALEAQNRLHASWYESQETPFS